MKVMALQVRPGSTEPELGTGLHESAKVIRSRPADSIRARDSQSHTQAGCMAAISTRNPEPETALGKTGRPCMPGAKRQQRVAQRGRYARVMTLRLPAVG